MQKTAPILAIAVLIIWVYLIIGTSSAIVDLVVECTVPRVMEVNR